MSQEIPKSPVFPADRKWELKKRKGESDVTALVRALREEPSILEDQKIAWQRWRDTDKKRE